MVKKLIIYTCSVLLLASCGKQPISQSTQNNQRQSASSLNPQNDPNYGKRPVAKEEKFFFGLFKKKKKLAWGDQLVVEYQERMSQNAKDAKKKARKMKKPQYSDPTYFGHKRKPKKRSPDKMKFCEECGIRH